MTAHMTKAEIDEDLYSRQILVLGLDAMKKMATASVLITGMGGLGVEIAKDVILAGVRSVTIHDQENVKMSDLASQFYLSEEDIGHNRAIASLPSLLKLNEYVSVSASECELTHDFISKFNTVVLTCEMKEDVLLDISEFCHSKGIRLIVCATRGLFGYLFNDFGDDFLVAEPRADQQKRFLIESITCDKEGIVKIDSHEETSIQDGDKVRFEQVGGMTELNGKEFTVKVVNAKSFSIGDTSAFTPYSDADGGGYCQHIIPPMTMHFRKLSEALKQPQFEIFDFAAFGRDQQVMMCFWALNRVLAQALDVTFENVLAACKALNSEYHWVEEISESLVAEFVREDAVLSPPAAVLGGIVGQEVLKSLSGKFTPFGCFFAFGYIESLPPERVYEPKGDRYDPYRLVFGNEQQEKMANLKYFLVGAGAIGCEILKNWAMMGVSSGPNGQTYVTDMDRIARSNLNRQFLFRNTDIGKMKSTTAVEAAQAMNHDFKAVAHQLRVGEESEGIYNDAFYTALDGVCNALDNVEARQYNDSQCIFYEKPMLESGTLGPMAHFEMVIPNMTASYSSFRHTETPGIPECTLHEFPSNINHCTMWAKDIFGGLFTRNPAIVNQYITDKGYVKKMLRADPGALIDNLRTVEKLLITEKPTSFDDCITWARMRFEEYFNWNLRDLLVAYPPNHVEDGRPFWGGARRLPTPAVYDPSNPQHASFVDAAARLYANIFGITPEAGASEKAASVTVPEWKPSQNTQDDGKSKKKSASRQQMLVIKGLCTKVGAVRSSPLLHFEEFEKDDPTNGHMDFVAAAANIRAANYRIPQATQLEIKGIAGNIIPAIATTTSMVCGFVCLEMYKIHCISPKKIDDYRSGFVNLATTMCALTNPVPCQTHICSGNQRPYTLWTKWVIEGDLTVEEFVQALKDQYGLVADDVMVGQNSVYSSFLPLPPELSKRKMSELYTEAGMTLNEGRNMFRVNVICGRDVETPDIYLKFR